MKKTSLVVLGLLASSIAIAQQPTAPASAPTSTTPPATTPKQNTGERNSAYTDRIPLEQMITLDANGDKFLARHIPDLSGLPRGAVIILHDSAQNPVWPFTVAALSDDLPLHGWDTLSIELPAPDPKAKPATTASSAPAAATPPSAPIPSTAQATPAAPASAPAGIEPRVQTRIATALKYYSDQQINNIVLIGFGSGTIRTAEFLRQYAKNNSEKFEPISALVMVMPLNKLAGIEEELPKILPATAAPALDLILDSSPLAKADAEARRRAVLHQRERIYRQLELPPINSASDAQHSVMVKRIRAWLQQNAATNTAKEKSEK